MDMETILLAIGLLVTIWGAGLNIYARHRFRTAESPGLWPQWRPDRWRTRREWFSSEHGYRMSRRGAMLMSLGGVIAVIASLV
jgi:hypothetical protein